MTGTQARSSNYLQGSKKLNRGRKGNDWLGYLRMGEPDWLLCRGGPGRYMALPWEQGLSALHLWKFKERIQKPRVDSVFIKAGSLFSLLKPPPHTHIALTPF